MSKISMDCIVYQHLNNKPVELRKGDRIEVMKKIDLFSQVRLLEGEAKGKVFTIDNLFIEN